MCVTGKFMSSKRDCLNDHSSPTKHKMPVGQSPRFSAHRTDHRLDSSAMGIDEVNKCVGRAGEQK